MTNTENSMAQKTSIRDLLTGKKTFKEGNGHQTPITDFKNFKRDNEKSHTAKADNSMKAPAGEHKTPYGKSGITLNRDSGAYLTTVGDPFSKYGPQDKSTMTLNPYGDDNTNLSTLR